MGRLASVVFLAIFLFHLGNFSQASEVDNFSRRNQEVKDSTYLINAMTNTLIQHGIEDANLKPGCSEKRLYKKLRRQLRIYQFWGNLTPFMYEHELVDRIILGVDETIYQDISILDAFVLGGVVRLSKTLIAPIVRVGDVYIGIDKIEHFLGTGHSYYSRLFNEGQNLEEVLAHGQKLEKGIVGAIPTGVMSYGDLAANFTGMRFWNHMLAKYPDPLGPDYDNGPYVACENNQWVRVNDVDWADYVDRAWDESINCSKFRNKKIYDKIQNRLKRFEKAISLELQCPVTDQYQDELLEKYSPVAHSILNFEGHDYLKKKE